MTVVDIKGFMQKAVGETKKVKIERLDQVITIEAITEIENDRLKRANTITRRSKNGNIVKDLDTDRYGDALVLRCIKSPDLNNAELQAFFDTEGDATQTLKAMLLAGEYANLTSEVLELNGFTESDEEIVEDVKK